MDFQNQLLAHIDAKHLLKHAFYQMWNEGTLPIEVMQKYAEQYYHLERAFPTFLALMLQTCDDDAARAAILDNFNDETAVSKNHRELWLRFGVAIGTSRDDMKNSTPLPETLHAIETFSRLCAKNYLVGAAALTAYESQIPAIAAKKLEGLQKNYGIDSVEGTEFFVVHGVMDIKHTETWWKMLSNVSESEKNELEAAAKEGAAALWGFLDGIMREYMPAHAMVC